MTKPDFHFYSVNSLKNKTYGALTIGFSHIFYFYRVGLSFSSGTTLFIMNFHIIPLNALHEMQSVVLKMSQ